VQARQQAEKDMRALVKAFGTKTRLTLGLTILQDTCAGGAAREHFFQDGDDQHKLRCWLTGTAYYTAPRDELVDVLTSIESEGDRTGSLVPFDRDSLRYPLDYYRNDGKVNGQRVLEPHLSAPTVTWSGTTSTAAHGSWKSSRADPVIRPSTGACESPSPSPSASSENGAWSSNSPSLPVSTTTSRNR
jgi:hypothetical protein